MSLTARNSNGDEVDGELKTPATICFKGDDASRYRTLVNYSPSLDVWEAKKRPNPDPQGFSDSDPCGLTTTLGIFLPGISSRLPLTLKILSEEFNVVARIGDAVVYVNLPDGACWDCNLTLREGSSATRPTRPDGRNFLLGDTVVEINLAYRGVDRELVHNPATVCINHPPGEIGEHVLYHQDDDATTWSRLDEPVPAIPQEPILRDRIKDPVPEKFKTGYACGQTRSFSNFIAASLVDPVDQKVTRISPEVKSIAIAPEDKVRLAVNVFGLQDILNNSLGDDVTFEWTSDDGTGSFHEARPRADDDSEPNDRAVVFTAPTEPGVHTVNVRLDSWECKYKDGESGGCATEIRVLVLAPIPFASVQATPADPTGEIPSILTDADGNQYEVFTPVNGGTFVGDGVTVTADSGAVPNGEILGVRAAVDGEASNVGQTHQRVTLAGNYYGVYAVDASGAVANGYVLDAPASVCIPLPSRLSAKISDVAMVSAGDAGTLSVVSSKVRIGTAGLQLCGDISELSARVAAAPRRFAFGIAESNTATAAANTRNRRQPITDRLRAAAVDDHRRRDDSV